jgi:hypothetical protein
MINARGTGTAIIVDGKTVAWFAEWTPQARDWCHSNHAGRWVGWKAKTPEIIALSQLEYDRIRHDVEEFEKAVKHEDQ